MLHRGIFMMLVILLMGVMSNDSLAQTGNDLYFAHNGDIWAWNDTMSAPEQLTEWGYNGEPILSPDGSRIAYLSVASEAVQRATSNPEDSYLMYLGTPTNNIWVMETAIQDFERIADQGDSFPIRRGTPAWSPTGDEIAWIEYGVYNDNFDIRAYLVVYNFNTQQERTLGLVNLGFQDAGIHLPTVQWGSSGISYRIFTFVESGEGQQQLYLHNANNGDVSQFILYSSANPFGEGDVTVQDYVWVEHNARAMIALLYSDGSWALLDPTNGSQFELAEAPSLIARNGNGSSLTPVATTDGINGFSVRWIGTSATGVTTSLNYSRYSIIWEVPALSPDGLYVAITDNGSVSYLRVSEIPDGGTLTPANPAQTFNTNPALNVVWTPMRWVTNVQAGEPIPTPSNPNNGNQTACDEPMRLAVRDFVTVTPGLPNNIRNDPSLNADFILSLYSGDLVSISDGPVCADGFRWWFIQGEGGFGGWTVEGSLDGDPWLIPLPQSPMVNICPLPPRLGRGVTGIVLPGDPNALRDGPDANGTTVIGSIPGGATFTTTGTSLCGTDGRRWYPVDYNGTLGWTAEGEGETYWIAPSS